MGQDEVVCPRCKKRSTRGMSLGRILVQDSEHESLVMHGSHVDERLFVYGNQ